MQISIFEESNEKAMHVEWGQGDPVWERKSEPSTKALKFTSVQFSRSVVSDSLQPHELQHARPP